MSLQTVDNNKAKRKFGGAQVGAGRPKGTVAARTRLMRKIAEDQIKAGETPLDIMLENMRFYHKQAEVIYNEVDWLLAKAKTDNVDFEQVKELTERIEKMGRYRDKAQGCAVDAAPFIHPKLAAIQVSGQVDSNVKMLATTMTDQEAIEAYRQALAAPPMKVIEQVALEVAAEENEEYHPDDKDPKPF